MEKVDKRREKIHHYIIARIGEGSAPTVREICRDLGIRSTSTVHTDLKHLADSGAIEMDDGLGRSIRLPGNVSRMVPLVGTVAAGAPILAVENIEQYIPVAVPGTRDELFALRVKGDSMIKAAILEEDIVVVEKTPVAENGQIVVALVEEEATVKRYYKEKGKIRLQPENDAYEPIILKEVSILGKVVSVVRFYS